jgi:hypothetical protein
MFEHLAWQDDRMAFNGLTFRLQHYKSENWDLGEECFVFYKIKRLVDQYEHFFSSNKPECRNFFELGLWEGGSIPFWYETLRPEKIVGIDLKERQDSAYFQRWVKDRGLDDRVKTYWGVNQADSARLLDIVGCEFSGLLDIVIDDASHVYEPTLTSFQTLFPRVRPGGFYIIEDWAWEHWAECHKPTFGLAKSKGLTELVAQLVKAAGTSEGPIKRVTAYQGFAVVERGDAALPEPFILQNHILERPPIAKTPTGVTAKLKKLLHA